MRPGVRRVAFPYSVGAANNHAEAPPGLAGSGQFCKPRQASPHVTDARSRRSERRGRSLSLALSTSLLLAPHRSTIVEVCLVLNTHRTAHARKHSKKYSSTLKRTPTSLLLALARQELQDHQEQVDEVQVKRDRADEQKASPDRTNATSLIIAPPPSRPSSSPPT